MIYIDELKNLRIYKRPFLLPIDIKNKRKGNSVMLLTPNIESSIRIMNHNLLINKYYYSYYLEKDVSFYINKKNVLEHYIDEDYIHDYDYSDEDLQINEGVFNKLKPTIIFNGYSDDVNEVKRYISTSKIEKFNSIFKADIEYPITVTVYRNPHHLPSTQANTINIISYKKFDNSYDYGLYCDEAIIEMLVRTINPKCYSGIVDAVIAVYSGTFDLYGDMVDNPEFKVWCRTIKEMSSQPNGHSKIVNIIRKNDITKLFTKAIDINSQIMKELLREDAMDPIIKLKRNITYNARKGSIHKINKITKDIEQASAPHPAIVPQTPTIGQPLNHPDSNENIENNEEEKERETEVTEYSLLKYLDDEYEVTESYIRTKNNITYFEEASESTHLKKLLYKQRLRNNKQVILMYDVIKKAVPKIKYTYLRYDRYKNLNLFVDLSFYNRIFFENNMYKLDRGVNIYFELLNRFINDPRLKNAGYNNKIVFIPIRDWDLNPETKMWLYNVDINPISVLYRIMIKDFEKLKATFKDLDFVFITEDRYFKVNFSKMEQSQVPKFLLLFKALRNNGQVSAEDIDDDIKQDSTKAIVDTIIDDIETSQNIKISHLMGDTVVKAVNSKEIVHKNEIDDYKEIEAKTQSTNDKDSKVVKLNSDKKEIINKIEKAAKKADSVDQALDLLDRDENFKKMLIDLASQENQGVIINNARAARIAKLDEEILNKEVRGMTVKQILKKKEEFNEKELEKTALPVDSINPEWQELTYINMANQYDPNVDIVSILTAFSKKTYPISVRNIEVQDTSTSEDYVYTYKVDMENHLGKRFTLKFDVPKFKNNQYMMLRGNRKTISSQSFLMPIIKTDEDTVQIVSNYNKIFIRRFGTTTGKSNMICDRIIKALKKLDSKDIKISFGDNNKVCSRYELPIDYIDLASIYTKIETPNMILYFNQAEIREKYKDYIDYKKGLPIGIWKNSKYPNNIIYYGEDQIITRNCPTLAHWLYVLLLDEKGFSEAYSSTNESVRYTYSKASILNTEIPVIVLAAYSEGLIKVLNKANIGYELTEKRPVKNNSIDFIKFNDGYLVYNLNYNSSLLLNGLKECPTDMYSIGDINSKAMYLDFLDLFGGRIKADGIDNFYDMMIDPITEDVLKHYNLPTDYIELLLYANLLLADNKYIKHGDMSGRRLRRNEIIAGYAYKVLSAAYNSYATQLKHGREAVMSMKQSAIIDAILTDPTSTDLSIINALNEKESYDTVTTKGLSGMNSDRSYSLDKRAFDESMINILGMSTGFAANVGISRQATINASVETVRGYVKPSNKDEMNSVNTLCMTEALTPFGTTRDDPFRSAMNFIQTSKHSMRCKQTDSLLVTNGADQALPYLVSDIFAHKAKDDGVIKEITDDYMIVEYKNGTHEYVDLTERVEKNSSSGFYVTLKLDTDLKVGEKIKKGQLLAYDKLSFDDTIGPSGNPSYKVGTLAKCALIDNDEGFEDSAVITEALSEAMTTEVVVAKEIKIPKSTNIYNMVQVGQKIEEGDTLMIMQAPFDEEDANTLLKNLVGDEQDITDLGRVKIKSKITGVVQDIVIYRTVELEELSESLQKICKKYESNIKSKKAVMRKYGIDQEEELPADYKLEPTGKLKGCEDSVLIVFYLKYEDKMAVGDKLIYWAAQKGVVKYIIPKGKEPYTDSRPEEKLHTLVSLSASNGRMVTSIQNIGIINRLLIEAARKAKDIAKIKYDANIL